MTQSNVPQRMNVKGAVNIYTALAALGFLALASAVIFAFIQYRNLILN
ncbi:MAG: hypothetical protein WCJ97_00500 [Phycisphaerae bacterium]